MSVTAILDRGKISHLFKLSFKPEIFENLDITDRAVGTSPESFKKIVVSSAS